MSAVRPMEPRPWHLGTYRRTTQVNASFTVTFWGSELHLYGDVGPSYGPYSIEVDGGTPQVRSAHYPALAVGPAGYLDGVSGLSEGRHEVVVRTLPRREGILEAEGFLLDYVLVRQRVGPVVGSLIPGIVDIQGSAMEQAITNRTGTWRSWSVDGDVILPDGRDARQPKTFFATNERGARITHSFSNVTAIQVYGTRNATHGAYRATLTSPSGRIADTYNGTAACDFNGPGTEHILPGCEWRGSVLKYAAGGLDPAISYQLSLENADVDGKEFELSLIREIGVEGERLEIGVSPDGTLDNPGNATQPGAGGQSGNSGSGTGNGAMARMSVGMPEVFLMFIAWFVLGRSLFGFAGAMS